jgi:hypothetical protein
MVYPFSFSLRTVVSISLATSRCSFCLLQVLLNLCIEVIDFFEQLGFVVCPGLGMLSSHPGKIGLHGNDLFLIHGVPHVGKSAAVNNSPQRLV